jgi:thymidylate synthase
MNVEPHVITGNDAIDSWTAAASLLVRDGDRFNLTVHLNRPNALDEAQVGRYCHRRITPSIRSSVYDVANTLFPEHSRFHDGDLDEFYDHYLKVYLRGQARHPTAWGCYFQRLISFGPNSENQLNKILTGLSHWRARPRAAFVLHLSSTDLDNPRPLGAPCWQYAQFIRNGDDVLSLVAVYRSHDYFQKALGNFVGLTRLLRFVCQHSNMTPGSLTCLSTYATLQGQRANTRRLLELQ